MKMEEQFEKARKFSRPYRVNEGKGFRLKDVDPADTSDFTAEDKPRAKEALAMGVEALSELQGRLYAQDSWAVAHLSSHGCSRQGRRRPTRDVWFTRVVVAGAIIDTLASLELKYPEVSKEKLKELKAVRETLLQE